MRSRTTKRTATLVLVAALAALTVSATWAFAQGGDRGWSMSRFGPGMMGYSSSGGGEPVRDVAGAKRQAQRFAERLDLRVGEVMRFENNYYAELVEPGGELGTEVLVNPTTGAVWLEYGPAMMWNTRYGMMGGSRFGGRSGMMTGMMGGSGADGMMSGGFRGDSTWAPSPVTRSRASRPRRRRQSPLAGSPASRAFCDRAGPTPSPATTRSTPSTAIGSRGCCR